MNSRRTKQNLRQLKIPGLQPTASRACTACGKRAEAFCARCGITPYCGAACQRRDWAERHRDVCHNLARLAGAEKAVEPNVDAEVPPPQPLRQPRSPAPQPAPAPPGPPTPQRAETVPDRGQMKPRQHDNQKNYSMNASRGGNTNNYRNNYSNESHGDNRNENRGDNRNESRGDNRNESRGDDRNENRGDNRNENRGDNRNRYESRGDNRNRNDSRGDNRNRSDNRFDNRNRNENRSDNRRPQPQRSGDDNEDWGSPAPQKPAQQSQPSPQPAEPVKPAAQPVKPVEKPVKPVEQPVKPVEHPVKLVQQPVKPIEQQVKPAEATNKPKGKPPASAVEFTTQAAKKLVPKNYLVETLSPGEEVMMSVDNTGSECRAGEGWVCLTLHSSAEESYQILCDQYAAACNQDTNTVTPKPGDTFSYLDATDGAWYRARCVTTTTAALLDCGRMVSLAGATCKPLAAPYTDIPEFCCLLKAPVQLGNSLKCILKSKTPRGFEVSLENAETGQNVGPGEVCRWVPEVEIPPPAPAAVVIPEVERPPVQNKSVVVLIDATAADRVVVLPTDTESQHSFNNALQNTIVLAQSVTPLKTPPTKGQTVISKFTDGQHYRALVKRTNMKQNKYLLEYIEFGNNHISPLEDLYPCPQELSTSLLPAVTSVVKLSVACDAAFTPGATAYIESIKEETELLLTLPDGAKSAPSGSEAVLTVVKTNENVNRKIEELCTPQWKKIEKKGGDVIEVEPIMFSSVEYLTLPANGCSLEILDLSLVTEGTVAAYPTDHPHAKYVFTTLTQKMEEYCNSEVGKEPYLPKDEELCIAQCPPFPQWFRAAFVERVGGPGSDQVRVLYIDYGNMEVVSAKLLRKMLPEFVVGLPALVCSLDINDFPKNPTEAQLMKAVEVMKVNEEGRGVLQVTRCVPGAEPGSYVVDAPQLIAAMKSV